ncbi:MAG: hypothetical protein ABI548_23125 [Polyangiaceae bacterium]
MGRSFRCARRVLLVASGFWLAACGLDSDLPGPNASVAPVDSAATLSGAGAFGTDSGPPIGLGEGSMNTGLGKGNAETRANGENSEASAGDASGGTDSGVTSSGSGGGIGGATSISRGGAASAGGSSGHAGAAGGGAGSASSNTPPPTLYFSEYIEGSSSNKALELSAQRDSVLDTCKVGAYFNGSAEASVIAVLSGTLAAGHVLTLCTSTLKTQLGAACDQVGRLTFNGNDAVAISCDGKLLDVIGQIGADPGAAWGAGTTTTADHTLRRKCSVNAGDANGLDAFEPSVEWLSFPADTFSGLGSRGC